MNKTIELLKEISEILLNNTCDNCEDYHSWSENPYRVLVEVNLAIFVKLKK